jgi:hypothetical protein
LFGSFLSLLVLWVLDTFHTRVVVEPFGEVPLERFAPVFVPLLVVIMWAVGFHEKEIG